MMFGVLSHIMKQLKLLTCTVCITASAYCCFVQFKADNLWPLVLAIAALSPIFLLSRRLFRPVLLLPIFTFLMLSIDAFAFQHRLAIGVRLWEPFFHAHSIADIKVSPSGKTTAYIVSSNWLDDAYAVYFSTRSLFLLCDSIDLDTPKANYPRDVSAGWDGPLFTTGQRLVSVAFDERQMKLLTYYDWTKGAHYESMTRESFAAYIASLRPKATESRSD